MPPLSSFPLVCALACLGATGGAWAEKADRSKPIVVEAERGSTFDLQRQVTVLNGNAVISQGTMVLRAERIELRETPDGYRAASAVGLPGKPATWRQRRDGGDDEVVEGSADRIEFDGRADTLRLVGNSAVRRLRRGVVADEITGASIVWDNIAEVFKVEGGASTAVNPTGRVRLTLTPRTEAASASAPRAAPLTPSRALETPR
ncbi:MAG: lipopolysaccharide transport periplasmic protein LptA [Betaproteobacteria bacterium]|jgi:lipopolysaccharide export system protein LptA|nr:lipopolysaccharide transport periplasmic protein LptA [Betaproteobacteria bacterium]